MTAAAFAIAAAVDDAAWRIVELELEAAALPPSDPRRAPLEQDAAMLRRRIEQLLLDEPDGPALGFAQCAA